MNQSQKDLAARRMAEWIRANWSLMSTEAQAAAGGVKLTPDQALEIVGGAVGLLRAQWVDLKTTTLRREKA